MFFVGCLGFTACAALNTGLVCTILRQDTEGGLAVAGFKLAFLCFELGVARAELTIG